MKQIMLEALEKARQAVFEVERFIWDNPETGYKEWKTSHYLEEKYRALGYDLTLAGDIPGFTALMDTGRPGPTVCVMGELDSLVCLDHPDADPVTGAVHACGHNAQSAALYGIASALAAPGALDGLCGKILLCAVPAEELIELEYRQGLKDKGQIHYFGGKVEFLYRGLLDGVDMAFMLHTSGGDGFGVDKGGNGCVLKEIAFTGVATHASSPRHAVNALYAANTALTACNALRETFDDEAHTRFHPIITQGGTVVNAIPSSVKLESYVRGADLQGILRENKKINRALAGSALAMGANVTVHDQPGYAPLHNDPLLNKIAAEAFIEAAGEERVSVSDSWSYGCTDMGDISCVMPAIQPYVGGASGIGHGNDYRIANPETACCLSAKGQLLLLELLLKDDAALAKQVLAQSRPLYPTFADYFKAMDAVEMHRALLVYDEQGARFDA